jgi:23S rRNA pseudouridine1911/1915/1917 synthase
MTPVEFLVEPTHAGVRLDHFLAERCSDHSRSRLQMFVREGHITVDGAIVRPNHKLRGGEKVVLVEPKPTSSTTEAQDIALDVLFEDEDVIVINKPAGLVVHPAAGHHDGTLVNALLFHCDELSGIGGVERPGIVHRLDKETSGCLVAAKNDLAHQSLTAQFAGRDVSKIYLAIATGAFKSRSGIVDAPIGRHRVHRQKMGIARAGEGKEAKTGWRVLGTVAAGALVECTLFTGRTHQIRVHMKHLGCPLAGDETYGKRGEFTRQMLHAWKLGFNHPRTGERIDLVAPIPEDFRSAGVMSLFSEAGVPNVDAPRPRRMV